ncbi:hypothetical protein HCUR_00896 [Holospora curviuscula]|uniref:Uncharacterized protein n=1 Tax=Holospora curviuscula TaxID=1082868 RepID=A0A2S5R8M8_9PROT|nr:hypothetical protein HCUR_00896 [Holospora curviuscula]
MRTTGVDLKINLLFIQVVCWGAYGNSLEGFIKIWAIEKHFILTTIVGVKPENSIA